MIIKIHESVQSTRWPLGPNAALEMWPPSSCHAGTILRKVRRTPICAANDNCWFKTKLGLEQLLLAPQISPKIRGWLGQVEGELHGAPQFAISTLNWSSLGCESETPQIMLRTVMTIVTTNPTAGPLIPKSKR